jgi:hypothetical protein
VISQARDATTDSRGEAHSRVSRRTAHTARLQGAEFDCRLGAEFDCRLGAEFDCRLGAEFPSRRWYYI